MSAQHNETASLRESTADPDSKLEGAGGPLEERTVAIASERPYRGLCIWLSSSRFEGLHEVAWNLRAHLLARSPGVEIMTQEGSGRSPGPPGPAPSRRELLTLLTLAAGRLVRAGRVVVVACRLGDAKEDQMVRNHIPHIVEIFVRPAGQDEEPQEIPVRYVRVKEGRQIEQEISLGAREPPGHPDIIIEAGGGGIDHLAAGVVDALSRAGWLESLPTYPPAGQETQERSAIARGPVVLAP